MLALPTKSRVSCTVLIGNANSVWRNVYAQQSIGFFYCWEFKATSYACHCCSDVVEEAKKSIENKKRERTENAAGGKKAEEGVSYESTPIPHTVRYCYFAKNNGG